MTASGADVQLSDLRSPGERKVLRLDGHTGPVRGIETAAAGDRFVTFGDDRTARVWRFDGLSTSELFRGHAGGVASAALSPDGHVLATGGEDGIVRMWNLEPGAEPVVRKTRGRFAVDAWFTADDRFVVARSDDPRSSSKRGRREALPPRFSSATLRSASRQSRGIRARRRSPSRSTTAIWR